MMTLTQARAAIISRITTFTGIEASRIYYADQPVSFTTPASGLWCRVDVMFGDSLLSSLAETPNTRRLGQLQVTCFARKNTGNNSITMLADSWLSHLEYYSKDNLELLNASIKNDENDDFIMRYVIVPFRVN